MRKLLTSLVLTVLIFGSVNVLAAGERGYVNCDALNLRVSPNKSCEVVKLLPTGTVFDILYTENGWYNIRLQSGLTGFVSADYVTKISYDYTSVNSNAEKIAQEAHNYIGCSYVYGASGPNAFDCSGFTSYLYKKYGYSIPRTADYQAEVGISVDKASLAPGDLVFFSNRSNRSINHVGIYVGNGNFIHASTSIRGVVMDSLYSDYYTRSYVCARRML